VSVSVSRRRTACGASPGRAADGKEIKLEPPVGEELPSKGFDPGHDVYQARRGTTPRDRIGQRIQQ
jgi:hypothetical protein